MGKIWEEAILLPFGILYLHKRQSGQGLLYITLKISHKQYIKAPYFGQIYSRYIHASTELDQWKLTKELQMALYIKQYNIRETIWKYILSLTDFSFFFKPKNQPPFYFSFSSCKFSLCNEIVLVLVPKKMRTWSMHLPSWDSEVEVQAKYWGSHCFKHQNYMVMLGMRLGSRVTEWILTDFSL